MSAGRFALGNFARDKGIHFDRGRFAPVMACRARDSTNYFVSRERIPAPCLSLAVRFEPKYTELAPTGFKSF